MSCDYEIPILRPNGFFGSRPSPDMPMLANRIPANHRNREHGHDGLYTDGQQTGALITGDK
jgi:hypothetical protein